MLGRRGVLGGMFAVGISACSPPFALSPRASASPSPRTGCVEKRTPEEALAAIATRSGGKLGIAALDTGSGHRISLDRDKRAAFCSTFKVPLAAAILARVDVGAMALDGRLAFTDADVLDYAPVVKEHLADHALTVAQACAGAVELSDNSAANLLLREIGGPAGLTRFMRAAGDRVSRLDRYETALNLVAPGEVHDTTTPAAMLALLETLLLGDVLSPASRAQLIDWMIAGKTGGAMLRAGLPADWRVGDKTGRSGTGWVNDVAIAWPPGRAPILIAAYLHAPSLSADAANAIHADVARTVAAAFA